MKLPPEHFRAQAEHAQPTRFGEKLMQQMGWEKGQGLGREGQGRKEHIRVKRKDDNEGVGSRTALTGSALVAAVRLSFSFAEAQTQSVPCSQIGSGGGWNWGVKWWEQVFDEQATALLQVSLVLLPA